MAAMALGVSDMICYVYVRAIMTMMECDSQSLTRTIVRRERELRVAGGG
jgi:hypothetical protein